MFTMNFKKHKLIGFCIICLIKCTLVWSCDHDSCSSIEKSEERNVRKERALLFPPGSTIGILAAIALPLDDRKNVFLSYNFEANYNSPYLSSDYIPGPLDRLQLVRSFDSEAKQKTENSAKSESDDEFKSEKSIEEITTTTKKTPKSLSSLKIKRNLITRTNLYKTIERKLNTAGYNGHDCLLRTICEAAETPLGLNNGVLGDMMHIIFTPSTSAKENILSDFYDAEVHGTIDMCKHYSKNCPESIFDWISIFE